MAISTYSELKTAVENWLDHTLYTARVPEFIVLPVVDGSEDYLRWVERSVGPRAES